MVDNCGPPDVIGLEVPSALSTIVRDKGYSSPAMSRVLPLATLTLHDGRGLFPLSCMNMIRVGWERQLLQPSERLLSIHCPTFVCDMIDFIITWPRPYYMAIGMHL